MKPAKMKISKLKELYAMTIVNKSVQNLKHFLEEHPFDTPPSEGEWEEIGNDLRTILDDFTVGKGIKGLIQDSAERLKEIGEAADCANSAMDDLHTAIDDLMWE